MRKSWRKIRFFMLGMLVFCGVSVLMQAEPAQAKAKLSKKTVYLARGESVQLRVTGAAGKTKWSSSSKSIAKVSKTGKVKAKNIGTATITAKVRGKKLKCKVIVEKKSVNRARVLRSYVLSKGKYKKAKKGYVLSYHVGKYNTYDATVTARKKDYALDFFYEKHAESSYTERVSMKIDLITGEAQVRTGDVEVYYDYDIDETYDEDTTYGTITTAFDGKGNGFLPTKYVWYTEDENGNTVTRESTEADVLASAKEGSKRRIKDAFAFWNEMFSKKYPALKKAGVTMKKIGFGAFPK